LNPPFPEPDFAGAAPESDQFPSGRDSIRATPISAEILHTVQRPASKERQNNIGSYQENYLPKPKPLHESTEQRWVVRYNFYVNDERWDRMFLLDYE